MLRNKNRVTTLVIKPFLGCDSNCPTCESRQELYKKIKNEQQLTLVDWYHVLEEGRALGAEELIVSGGEPTLYEHLLEIIVYAKKLGYKIEIYTSGGNIPEKKAEEFLKAGLTGVRISLLSAESKIHDKMKNNKGLWKRACDSIRIFKKLKSKFPDFSLSTQFYVTKDNYQELDNICMLHYKLGSDIVIVNYLQWDFRHRKYSLNEEEIKKVRAEMIPRMMAFNGIFTKRFFTYNRIGIENFYNERVNKLGNFSRSEYNKNMVCPLSDFPLRILANGNVLPCCLAEYAHEPIIGNVLDCSLKKVVSSAKFADFKKNSYFR